MAPASDRTEDAARSLVVKPDGRRWREGPKRSTRPFDAGRTDRPGLAARMAAARLLAAIVDAHTSLDGLTDGDNGHPQYRALDARDRALVRAILNSALRYRVTIGRMLDRHIERPLPANARLLFHILYVAAAQVLFLDVPDSAAVDLAVTHARGDPRTARFAALVNAVLRAMARARESTLASILAATVDAPDWFRERLAAAYGVDEAAAILAVHRLEPPFDFTVKADPSSWAERLGGIVLPTGSVRVARLDRPVAELPGYAEGEWWVQDAAAALPARLLGAVGGKRIADLCAAPGGKSAQLALAGADLTVADISANRLKRLAANLSRLGLDAKIVAADILEYRPAEPFDAVLLDAPCSSTGTVRRHPDVPWTKTTEDIAKLAEVQRKLLGHAVTLLKPGGRLVFSNCSLDPAEGENLLDAFLADTDLVRLDPVAAEEVPGIAPFLTPRGTLRTTPADLPAETPTLSGMDGFFAARLVRT